MEFRRQITAEKVRKTIEFSLNFPFINPAESPAGLTKISSKSSSPINFSFKWNLRTAAIVLSGSALAIFLILIVLYFLFGRFLRRRRSEAAAPPPPNEDFLIEIGHEPYHIWYIKTAGLDQPTIEAISVVPFKKSEGKAHGSDCAVCLGEFQEEEMLRLLPKCNHAFHVSCIDTWLHSHVNCPICRSLIADPAQNPSASSSNLDHSEGESEDIEPLPAAESEIEYQESEIAKEGTENQESGVMDRSTSMDSAPR